MMKGVARYLAEHCPGSAVPRPDAVGVEVGVVVHKRPGAVTLTEEKFLRSNQFFVEKPAPPRHAVTGAPRRIDQEPFVEVTRITLENLHKLFQIAGTLHLLSALPGFVQRGQQQGSQNRNDRNYNEQFN